MLYRKRTELADLLSGPFEINRDSPQAAGLVAWWPMLGDAGMSKVRDRARGNLGTFGAGMGWKTNAKLGPMPLFSSSGIAADDDYIALTTSINLGTTHTIAYWAILNNTAAPETGMPLGGASLYYLGRLYSNTIYYSANVNIGVAFTYTRGTLAHFAFVRVGTIVTVYINGVQLGTPQTLSANNDLTIGTIGAYNNFTYGINGQLQGLVMSSLALPPPTIWQMAQPDTMFDLYMVRRRFWAVKAAAGRVGIYGARPELRLPGGVSIQAVH